MPRPRGGLVDFYFKPVKPGIGPTSPTIFFPAHILSVSDSNSPQWDEVLDMGRPDPKVMYKGFSRTVNVTFMVVAVSEVEHDQNYESMKKLGLLTYPIFEGGSGYNSMHVQFKIGNLLGGIGYVGSLDYSWGNESPWIRDKPLITDATITIRVLTDFEGNRPNYKGGNYNYFGVI